MKKEMKIQKTEVQQTVNPDLMIAEAVKEGLTVETMKEMFELRKDMKKEFAKEQFDLAMANFQGDCPTIVKTKEVRNASGMFIYSYAPIDSIVSQVKDLLKQNGLSYMFKTKINGEIIVQCTIKHITGHQEISEMALPKSNSDKVKSSAQAIGGDVTFAKRYAFCNALGIMTGDEDIDAKKQDAKPPVDVEAEKKMITDCKTMQQLQKVGQIVKKGGKHKNQELVDTFKKQIDVIKNDIPVIKE